jgi:hypothetical protein
MFCDVRSSSSLGKFRPTANDHSAGKSEIGRVPLPPARLYILYIIMVYPSIPSSTKNSFFFVCLFNVYIFFL